MAGANIYFLQMPDGWHIVIRHDDGEERISDQAFPTQDECKSSFDIWAAENNFKVNRAQ